MTTREKILREIRAIELPGEVPGPSSQILDLAVRYREALESIDKMGDMTDAQFRKAGGNFQIFKIVTAALRPK